jgi:hypothetical protein
MAAAIREGDEVLVHGRVHKVFAAEGLVEVTFAKWWPRWSAVLVKIEQVEPVAISSEPEPGTSGKS